MRTFYQYAITDLPTNHLTSWDLGKQLPVEDYRADYRPPARLALIKIPSMSKNVPVAAG